MRWSLRLGRFAGTEVRVHITFFVLLAGFGWFFYMQGGLAAAVDGVLLILAVFACVLLHEYGHVLTAKKFGVRTPDITLLPIGGMARMERMPEKPWQELLVAVAGPAVNVVIAGILFLVVGFPEFGSDPDALIVVPFWQRLLLINIALVVFNMIPAFPMDGGRVLRALLAMVLDYGKATELAAAVGQFLAVLGGLLGIRFMNPILVLIAVFIFMAARAEAEMVRTRRALRGVRLQDAMITDFRVLGSEDTLEDAATALLAGAQHDFPVLDASGELEGLLTRPILLQAVTKMPVTTPVRDVMLREVPTGPMHYPLKEAFQLLRTSPLESLPVVADGRRQVKGLLTAENVGELILLRSGAKGLIAAME